MGVNKDIYSLDPVFAKKVAILIDTCAEQNIELGVVEAVRDRITQLLYFIQGRITEEDIQDNPNIIKQLNKIRSYFKFYELSDMEANKKITWTLDSKHFYGRAVDVCPIKNGRFDWNAPDSVWEQIYTIAESLGLECGGRWPQKDKPHIQYNG